MLTFRDWARERVGKLIKNAEGGRGRVTTSFVLAGERADGSPADEETCTVSFLLAGAPDVRALLPGAIAGRYPAPGAIDAETDKCTHVELAEPALPWRYSPDKNPAPGSGLRPWLALVVGVEGEELTLAGGRVSLTVAVQQAHPLVAPYTFAHVQEAQGRSLARVLSLRPLQEDVDYLAVLVPAVPGWTGAAQVTLPVYDHWRFRTAAERGSFPTLAGRLRPGRADPETGRAAVRYPYLPGRELKLRGALAPLGSLDEPLDPGVAADLARRCRPIPSDGGAALVGPPVYGDAWPGGHPASDWARTLNGDPRHRGAAGLGLELGIRLQEELADEAREHMGALGIAHQWLSRLSLGLAASEALWRRRLPEEPLRQLWLFGPALRRVVTPEGPISALTTAPGMALPSGIFSTAARRVLRHGPARTALAADKVDPIRVLQETAKCRPVSPPEPEGVAYLGHDFDERLRETIGSGQLAGRTAVEGLATVRPEVLAPALGELAQEVLWKVDRLFTAGDHCVPWGLATEALTGAERATRALREAVSGGIAEAIARAQREVERAWEELRRALDRMDHECEPDEDVLGLLGALQEPAATEPCRPVLVEELADGLVPLFDPTTAEAPARVRVLDLIRGLDKDQPLAPPEVCPGLDRPAWRDLNDAFAEWLLPGVGRLPDDSAIAMETNPSFIDAFLVGYNTQLLGELRWRDIPVAAGCTPLKVFWERVDTATGAPVRDLAGVPNWPSSSALGSAAHRPGGQEGRDLVLVFRGQLFLRYPKTLVYLVSAEHDHAVDFTRDPDPAGIACAPAFQGRIGADVTFFGFPGFDPDAVDTHWVVLEEPPSAYRFRNDAVADPWGRASSDFADRAFADPYRVLIRGDKLLPRGGS
ncbi:hypothetical protein [Nonomuraea endophytica]|uniref:Uncharacterized protein n=1 Tax=Nonomuraea endophytica TaxID=714136 RepID=A0A7W8A4A1_9ACTN|nr:hypothetical protein [Nonomuraea endophytica]MBB5079312.1 hypothetical protein [Nonomuraea endophytica]